MNKRWTGVARWLDQVRRESDTRGDAQLLEAFLRYDDPEAFARLVRRHGPMVQGVCRRVLGHSHDVEDAFQATFLVLLRKAASLQWRERLGPWLYGVAHRTALKAHTRRSRSRVIERPADDMTPEPTTNEPPRRDGVECLDEELLAMPEKYRLPLVLCELQGLSRREAARVLKLPEGTLSSRLARGRQMLRRRLTQRGVTVSAAGLLTLLAAEAKADLSLRLVGATVRTAAAVHAGQVAGVTTSILTLTEGVVKSMLLAKLKTISAVVVFFLVLGGLTTGTLAMAWGQDSKPAPAPVPSVLPPQTAPAATPPPAPPQQLGVDPTYAEILVRLRVIQQDRGGEPKVLAEPQLVTLLGRPASVHIGGEKPVELGYGQRKDLKHVPYGTQVTVTPVLLDRKQVRLEIMAALDAPEQADGFDYHVVGSHVRCMKTIRFSDKQDTKVVLKKHADGSPQAWIELQIEVGFDVGLLPEGIPDGGTILMGGLKANAPSSPLVPARAPEPAPQSRIPVNARACTIEANIKQAAGEGQVPVTLSIPRVTTFDDQPAILQFVDMSGKQRQIDLVVKGFKSDSVVLSFAMRESQSEVVDNAITRKTTTDTSFLVDAKQGQQEKVVLLKTERGTPLLWVELKVDLGWQVMPQATVSNGPIVRAIPVTANAASPMLSDFSGEAPDGSRGLHLGGGTVRGVEFESAVNPNGARGLRLQHVDSNEGPRVGLSIGAVYAEGTRFRIGSGDQAYVIAAAANGMAVKGPAVQTICTEMVFRAGLPVRVEPFTTDKGRLRAEWNSQDKPAPVHVQWGDAELCCSKLEFQREGTTYVITPASDGLLMTSKDSAIKCKAIDIDLRRFTVVTEGAAEMSTPKRQ